MVDRRGEGGAGRTVRLYADDGGVGGLPVVFLHSLAGNVSQWSAQLDHLRPRRRAVVLDWRGTAVPGRRRTGTSPSSRSRRTWTRRWTGSASRGSCSSGMLTDPASYGGDPADSFDVVVPSVPGYGFSDRPIERGFTSERVADLFVRLMTEELGYERFGAHGGDVGSGVTEKLVAAHADSLVGAHLTDIPYWHLFTVASDDLSPAEQNYLEAGGKWQMEEGAYALIQSTKPQTPAYGLNDSPVGLAAWIVEKFRSWSDCDGDIERRFSKGELHANAMIYWTTETIGSAFRIYYETLHNPPQNNGESSNLPTGVAIFPKDLVPAPREFAERFFDIRRWTEMPRGGHFAAMEEPDLLVGDARAFFRGLR